MVDLDQVRELTDTLADFYKPVEVPSCRLCGGKLSIARIEGGAATLWACADRSKVGANMDAWYDHYSQSYWTEIGRSDRRVVAISAGLQILLDQLQMAERYGDVFDPTRMIDSVTATVDAALTVLEED